MVRLVLGECLTSNAASGGVLRGVAGLLLCHVPPLEPRPPPGAKTSSCVVVRAFSLNWPYFWG